MNNQQLNNKYYEESAKDWANQHNTQKFWGEYMDKFHKLLPQGKILEIGFGAGRDAKELIEMGYDLTGIDPAQSMVDITSQRVPEGKFFRNDVREIEYNNEFDGFWACASLLHIPKSEIDLALQKINNALKLGAIGFISIKKHNSNDEEENIVTDERGDRFFAFWNKDDFVEKLEKNGFELATEVFENPMSEKTHWLIFLVRKIA